MSTAAAIGAILGSAVIVLSGLIALVRAIWRIAQTLRDNTRATQGLTGQLEELTSRINGEFDALAERVARLEQRRR